MAPQLSPDFDPMPPSNQELDDVRQLATLATIVRQLSNIVEDHEKRLRRMEKYTNIILGGVLLLHFVTEWIDKLSTVKQVVSGGH